MDNKLHLPNKGYKLFKTRSWLVFIEGLWHNNPIFGMLLGLCSTLAVTNIMSNALVMSLSVTIVLIVNSVIISSIRNLIPEKVRMIIYMMIVSTLVIVVDKVLKIFLPQISTQLGPYVGLIITNCIIMGRAEAFAVNNSVYLTFIDSLGVGLGYTFSLMTLSFFREILGFGSILGFKILPDTIEKISLLSIPPGAFFALGIFILIINIIRSKRSQND